MHTCYLDSVNEEEILEAVSDEEEDEEDEEEILILEGKEVEEVSGVYVEINEAETVDVEEGEQGLEE
jgi:hypothetical protein